MEFKKIMKDLHTEANGVKAKNTAMVRKNGPVAVDILAAIPKIVSADMGSTHGGMEDNMKETGLKTNLMEKANGFGLMDGYIQVPTWTVRNMAVENSYGLTVLFIEVIG